MKSLLPGDPQHVGDYWLAGRLGEGGQGVVYDAYDGEGRRVAIKVLHASGDERTREQLARESAAARRVASFCTARVLHTDLEARKPYIVSEYVEGRSLRAAGRRFTGDDLHRLGTAIVTALTAIHEAGVLHRDLKPDNVLLSPDGPRVIDFGVARTADMSLTATGQVAGTPTYMAPEVFTGQRADAKADVFAWGAIMVFAATGEDPFRADTLGAVMHKVLSLHPDLSAIPPSMRPLVEAALEKDPEARPTSRGLLLALVSGYGGDIPGLMAEGTRTARGVHVPDTADPALGTIAEDAYGALAPEQRELAPEVFLRLVAIGEDGRESGRLAPREELIEGRPEREATAVEHILRVFSYLVSEKDGAVGLTRPALLRAWPRLRMWVEADRDGLALLGQIATAARYWAENGRRDGDLLQGSRLEGALSWAATRRKHLSLTQRERDFLTAGTSLARKRARRRRLTTIALAGLLVAALAAGGVAVRQSGLADDRRDIAIGRQVAAEADRLRTTDAVKAMLLSVAGWRLAPGADTRASLMASLYRPERAVFRQPPAKGIGVRTVSQDGRTLVSASEEGTAVYDVRTGRRRAFWKWPGARIVPLAAELSPSGKLLVVVTERSVTAWDTMTGAKRAEHPVKDWASAVPAFGGNESIVAIKLESEDAVLWNVRTGRIVQTPLRQMNSVVVAPDGRMVAGVGLRGLEVRRLPGLGKDTRFPEDCGTLVTFSRDGRYLLCAGAELTRFDVATGEAVPVAPGADDTAWWAWAEDGSAAEVDRAVHKGVRFSADGTLVVGFADASIRLWSVATGARLFSYRTEGVPSDVWVDPDGRTIRYLQDDEVVSLDVRSPVSTSTMRRIGEEPRLSPDGRWVVTTDGNGESPLRIWDVRARRYSGVLPGTEFSNGDVVFDRSGRTVVTGISGNDLLRAWDVATRRLRWRTPVPDGDAVTDATFTADGKRLLVVLAHLQRGRRPVYRLWELDAGSGRPIRKVPLSMPIGSVAYTGDGKSVVSDVGRIFDAATGRPVDLGFPTIGAAGLVATSPIGPLVAVSGGEGTFVLWDTQQYAPVPPALRGTLGISAVSLAFSPDGSLVAAYGDDANVIGTSGRSGLVQVWDVETKRLVAAVPLVGDAAKGLAFTADGRRLIAIDRRGTLSEIPVAEDQVAEVVCERAGRTLAPAEWRRYLIDVPYLDICPPAGRQSASSTP
ncbi:WD40 repeat domain-containing serine/threonine protein kinase [Microtetraspora malaysiensis]|uniref:WD40 repeat domain-containing serine/threonine protein kinase n=1 Tax=Microtetraspora malaysiensis TaxID=161358 RepID=UPI003D934A97